MAAKWASVRSLPARRPASLFVRLLGGMAVLLALVWAALGVFGLWTVESKAGHFVRLARVALGLAVGLLRLALSGLRYG